MKRHFLLTGVLAALCIFTNVNLAFSGDWTYGIGFTAGVGRLEGDASDPQISPLISGHLRVQPIPYLSFSGELGFSPLDSDDPSLGDFKTTIVPFELSAIFNFLPFKKVNPFVFAGGGGVYWEARNNDVPQEDGLDSFLKTGGGLEFRLTPAIGVSVGATYRFSLTDAFDQLRQGDENDQVLDVYAGLTYYFNKQKNDSDRDFIPDELDLMPEIAEDRDGYLDHDGIPEKNPSPVALGSLEAPLNDGNEVSSPVVIHNLLTRAESGSALDIKANVYSQIDLKVVAIIYRPRGTPNWNVVRMRELGLNTFEAQIPSYAVTTQGLEYCVVAVDETLSGIGYSGLPSKPIQVRVSPSGKPWRFVGGAIGAATIGTASYLILRKQD